MAIFNSELLVYQRVHPGSPCCADFAATFNIFIPEVVIHAQRENMLRNPVLIRRRQETNGETPIAGPDSSTYLPFTYDFFGCILFTCLSYSLGVFF